jgi:GTP pyrophosphokinase
MHAIHSRWTPIVAEIRDYIWAPLSNGYQSLHTTVTIDQHPIKFQIRTTWMHRTSQLGIIAYMQEGEWSAANPALTQTLEDLRRFGSEASEELSTPLEFISGLKREILADEIYVYTPKNEAVRLPAGATPLDFAYRIHTMVGHNCRGALVDGRWTALNRPLRSGERVQILTIENGGPCYNWLTPELGYTQSALARAKIRRWFRRRPDEIRIETGRRQFARVLDRLALEVDDLSSLAKRFGLQDQADLYREVGGCDLAIERVLPELLQIYGTLQLPEMCDAEPTSLAVTGLGSQHGQFAQCCQPQPNEDLVGYIHSTPQSVEIHRSDCKELLQRLEHDRARLMPLRWGRACETYQATMGIYAHDRPFLLRDVWNIIFEEGINVSDVDVHVNRAQDATVVISIDVENWLQFHRVLVRIEDLPGTIWVKRQTTPATPLSAREWRQAAHTPTDKRHRRPRGPLFSLRFLGR